jgi:hypothetical protein
MLPPVVTSGDWIGEMPKVRPIGPYLSGLDDSAKNSLALAPATRPVVLLAAPQRRVESVACH